MGAKPLAVEIARWATVATLENEFSEELLWLAQAIIDRDRAMMQRSGERAQIAWLDAEAALRWRDADAAVRAASLPDLVATALLNLVEEHHGRRHRGAGHSLGRLVKGLRGGRPRGKKGSVPLSSLGSWPPPSQRKGGRPPKHPKVEADKLIAAAGARETIREGLEELAVSTLRAEGQRTIGDKLKARLRNLEEQCRAARKPR